MKDSLDKINIERVDVLVEDRILWNLKKDGRLSVKSLHGRVKGEGGKTLPQFRSIDAPPGVAFLTWEVT